MKKTLLTFGIAAIVVLAVIAGVFYVQRGAHLELQGKILKVRTAPIDDKSSVAVVDFRFTNVADYEFDVRKVTVILVDSSGGQTEGSTISEIDAERLFQGIPLLGQKYNPSLITRNKIPPHATQDRMIAARFEVPEDRLDHRQQLVVRIEEVDGAVSELREK
jgi:hypothetical protein